MGQDLKFFNTPIPKDNKAPTSEELTIYNQRTKKEQEADTSWRGTARKAFDNTIDAAMSFMGIPINDSRASQYGELVQAGLPFAAFAGTKGIKRIFHGTQRIWDKLDPSRYDKGDVLGWMTHYAEPADYAGKYAMGQIKGVKDISHIDLTPADALTYNDWHTGKDTPIRPRIIPAVPEAKNVLDLVDPNPDDISQALGFVDKYQREELINKFKSARRQVRNQREGVKDPYGYSNKVAFEHDAHYQAPPEEHPIRKVAESIRFKPEVTENMPWDAIRYHDMNNKSWALPARTPVKSQFGAELNDVNPINSYPINDFILGGTKPESKLPVLGGEKGKQFYQNWYDNLPKMEEAHSKGYITDEQFMEAKETMLGKGGVQGGFYHEINDGITNGHYKSSNDAIDDVLKYYDQGKLNTKQYDELIKSAYGKFDPQYGKSMYTKQNEKYEQLLYDIDNKYKHSADATQAVVNAHNMGNIDNKMINNLLKKIGENKEYYADTKTKFPPSGNKVEIKNAKTHGVKTPYIFVDEFGNVKGGGGDKEAMMDMMVEGEKIYPNPAYELGHGDNNLPFNFTPQEKGFLAHYEDAKPKIDPLFASQDKPGEIIDKDTMTKLYKSGFYSSDEYSKGMALHDQLPVSKTYPMPEKGKGQYVVMNTKGEPDYQYFDNYLEAQKAGNMPGKDYDSVDEFIKYNGPKDHEGGFPEPHDFGDQLVYDPPGPTEWEKYTNTLPEKGMSMSDDELNSGFVKWKEKAGKPPVGSMKSDEYKLLDYSIDNYYANEENAIEELAKFYSEGKISTGEFDTLRIKASKKNWDDPYKSKSSAIDDALTPEEYEATMEKPFTDYSEYLDLNTKIKGIHTNKQSAIDDIVDAANNKKITTEQYNQLYTQIEDKFGKQLKYYKGAKTKNNYVEGSVYDVTNPKNGKQFTMTITDDLDVSDLEEMIAEGFPVKKVDKK